MFREEGGRPNDERGFIHKRILGGIKGFVTTGSPLAGITGFLRPPARKTVPRSRTARPSIVGEQEKERARSIKFGDGFGGPAPVLIARRPPPLSVVGGGDTECVFPMRWDPRTQSCKVFIGVESGRDRPRDVREAEARARERAPVGDAVMGQYGAALEPGVMSIERSVCLPGMQLAKDGLCYNKGAITNSQRMWPRGRRPLLTGGDMRAIGIAARAGAKLDRTTKRLRALGMMKKLPAPRKAPHQHAKPIAAVSV